VGPKDDADPRDLGDIFGFIWAASGGLQIFDDPPPDI
jgi:hypothetical protein